MKQQLIENNMNLVYYIISREYPTYIGDQDIIQSGMLGLCRAADRWSEQGQFSTYAGKCIRNEIKQEFIRRKPHSQNISLETRVSEECVLADVLQGDDDVAFIDDEGFYNLLSQDEKAVLTHDSMGYSAEEIAEVCGLSVSKVWKLLRIILIKWRKYNGDSC